MRVDKDAVRGIVLKINRARNHFDALKREQDAWNKRRPCRLDIEQRDPEGCEYRLRLRLDEPIHIEWAVVLGEAIHDLRSALDQCVYWLSVQYTGREVAGTQFPIYTKKRNFIERSKKNPTGLSSTGGLYKIRGIGPGPHAFIEALQPYPQRAGRSNYSLRVLHDLWNQDKHRLVHVWGVAVTNIDLTLTGPAATPPTRSVAPKLVSGVLYEDAIAGWLTFGTPQPNVEMDATPTARIALRAPYRRRGGAQNLFTLWDDSANVVAKLVLALKSGDQDAPIEVDTWADVFLPRHVAATEHWPDR